MDEQDEPRSSDVSELYRETPGAFLVLDPALEIVDVSEGYSRVTLLGKQDIRGKHMFEAFPDNPRQPDADGVRNLRASLEQVLRTGRAHRMPIQRYDIRDRLAGPEIWIEKFWAPLNTPVFSSDGRSVERIVHQVQDVTQVVSLQQWIEEQSILVAEQLATVERMRRDLTQRQRELVAARDTLETFADAQGSEVASAEELRLLLRAPDRQRFFAAGELAPDHAIFSAFHARGCSRPPGRIFMTAGNPFAACPRCGEGVVYRLLRRG